MGMSNPRNWVPHHQNCEEKIQQLFNFYFFRNTQCCSFHKQFPLGSLEGWARSVLPERVLFRSQTAMGQCQRLKQSNLLCVGCLLNSRVHVNHLPDVFFFPTNRVHIQKLVNSLHRCFGFIRNFAIAHGTQ